MPRRTAARTRRTAVPHLRLAPEARRRQLVQHASRILTQRGIEHLQVTELAAQAGVSRPLVYRMFPTRQALMTALLEDFAALVTERFQRALMRSLPGTVESITTAFIEASCDAIEERGAGPWRLLDARGTNPAVTRLGRNVLARLLDPWIPQLALYVGLSEERAARLLAIIVAGGRAALDGWIDGALPRHEAVSDATRAVSALLVAFMGDRRG